MPTRITFVKNLAMIANDRSHAGIVLASKSSRRRQLLEQLGLKINIIPSSVDEKAVPETAPHQYVRQLARAKASDIASLYPDHWVIGADTIVLAEDRILGKPKDTADALQMLKRLSGITHKVLTGIAVICENKAASTVRAVSTEVTFKNLSDAEIRWYLSTGEPFDKAGGYGIQGLGAFMVRHISGSYTNVVGLPLCETVEILLANKAIKFTLDAQKPAE